MQLHYVLEYRDEADAAAARFPGEPTRRDPRVSLRAGLLGWSACIGIVVILYLLLSRASAAGGAARSALIEADLNNHPVFVAGVVLVAIGGAMCVCPAAYAVALRRSTRAVHEHPVSVRLGEDGIALRSAPKELFVGWDGVLAVVELRKVFVIKTVGDLRFVLPKRACETPEAADAVADLFRRHVPPLAAAPQLAPGGTL
jgi:hypothetical protein